MIELLGGLSINPLMVESMVFYPRGTTGPFGGSASNWDSLSIRMVSGYVHLYDDKVNGVPVGEIHAKIGAILDMQVHRILNA